ncbi:MAG: DNA polymerase I [Clostridiaceae bacterium]|nr:DNA polymerase I [Clostridiaceae bacterium]
MNEKFMIVDGNSILNRAFYALKGPGMLTRSDGTPTNAVYGFINILNKYLDEEKPDYLAVAFDLKAKIFRSDLYAEYKATRKGMPDELAIQLPIVKRVLKAMNIAIVEEEGLEADDLIGIYSKIAENQGIRVSILTGDRDALQLASELVTIIIPSTSKGQTITTRYTPADVLEKYGVEPKSLIEIKGLMGDQSDNIPGVKGVGEKTAIELIKQYKTLEELYENLDSISKPKLRANLEEGREMAFLSRRLGTIIREKEGINGIEDFRRREINKKELLDIFTELEFRSLIKKLALDAIEREETEASAPQEVPYEKVSDLSTLKDVLTGLSEKDNISLLAVIEKAQVIGGNLNALAIGHNDVNYVVFTDKFDDKELAEALSIIFSKKSLTIVTHNVKELYTWALSHDTDIECGLFDLMIAEYLIDALASSYTIPELARKYLGVEVSLDEVKGKGRGIIGFDENKFSQDLSRCLSVINPIYEKQTMSLAENGQQDLYYQMELPLSLVLGSMEYYGFKVDAQYLEEYGKRLDARIRSLEQSIYMMAGEEFNINSTKQLGIILFEKLGLRVIKKTKTGYSTDADVLNELSDDHEIIPAILEYRQLTKLKSTYVEGLVKVINPETGRIHSSFNQTVTATGRISSTEPNLQNIPIRTEVGRDIRRAFIPEEGFMFVDADYSQIELRVLAHITGDEMLQKAFVEGVDIHTQTASQVFKVPLDEVTSEMRRSAKAVNFGIIYGISDFSLAKDINVTRKEAARYIENYLSTYAKVKQYMEDIVEYGKEKGYVKTMFNRIRHIPELKSSNFQVRSFGKRIALNTPIQGSAADIIKIAMVKVWRELKERKLKSRLILQVHDELVVETAMDELEQVKDIVKNSMESAVALNVPLIAEVTTGENWYEAK